MKNITNIVTKYYEDGYVEDDRLTKDNVHYIEFITTTQYIDKYLKPNTKILEVGAGTGAYSLYYAKKGYSVDALELVDSNIEVMNKKITKEMNIRTIQGNALDLSIYEDNTFDITLVLGPLYHLFKKEEQEQVLKEAIRVTKKNGIIFTAYILFDLSMLNWGIKYKNLYDNYGNNKMVNKNFTPNNQEEYIFNLLYFDEVKELINNNESIESLHYVATDGIGRIIKELINEMTEEEYNLYLNYHLSICEREDLIGYSGHILNISKKK